LLTVCCNQQTPHTICWSLNVTQKKEKKVEAKIFPQTEGSDKCRQWKKKFHHLLDYILKTWQWLDYSLDHTTICGKGENHNITSGQLQYLLLGRLFRIFGTKPRYNPRRPSRAMIPVRE
jgi:hypothetical protein